MKRLLVIALVALLAVSARATDDPLRHTPIVQAVEKARHAVVNVFTQQVVESRGVPFGRWQDPLFDEFFRDFFEPRQREYRQTSLGSGVIIRPDGYVLTNQHVIVRASQIHVSLADERTFAARLVGADADSDLAVLKIDGEKPLPYLEMGDSSDLLIGETVIAIGNPFGLSHTVTTGVISAVGRSVRTPDLTYYDFIQTDASINPGNSGGPLLNLRGELIGINTAIYQRAQGIGFATPIDRARRIVEDLIEYGEVHVPWVGAILQDLTPELATHFDVKLGKGVLVRAIERDSPADAAGVQPGDVVTAVGERGVGSVSEYEQRIRDYPEDASIPLKIVRDHAQRQIIVRARAFPDQRADALAWEILGIGIRESAQGVHVVRVREGSPAARVGLRRGDGIVAIAGVRVATRRDFRRRVVENRLARAVLLSVQRGIYLYHVPMPVQGDVPR